MKVINFGSLNVDYVYALDHIVKPGETISSHSMEKYAGGKGLNQSIAISRAGGKITHAGLYGTEGEFLFDLLKGEGVDVSCLEKRETANGHAIIQVDKEGENSIVLFAGTNGMIDEDYIDRVLKCEVENDYILFQNETSSIGYAMKSAKEKGYSIVFNPAPMNEKVLDYPLELVDIFVVNHTEGQMLSGQKETADILNTLNEKYPSAKIILTLGSDGSWFLYKKQRFHIDAVKAEKVVDTTAAGDTFIGYYLAGLCKGQNDREALEIAARASSVCVSKKGAAVSIPRVVEISE